MLAVCSTKLLSVLNESLSGFSFVSKCEQSVQMQRCTPVLEPLGLSFACAWNIWTGEMSCSKVGSCRKKCGALVTVVLEEFRSATLIISWDHVELGQYGRPWWWRWRCSRWLHIWHQSCFHAHLSWRSVLVQMMVPRGPMSPRFFSVDVLVGNVRFLLDNIHSSLTSWRYQPIRLIFHQRNGGEYK